MVIFIAIVLSVLYVNNYDDWCTWNDSGGSGAGRSAHIPDKDGNRPTGLPGHWRTRRERKRGGKITTEQLSRRARTGRTVVDGEPPGNAQANGAITLLYTNVWSVLLYDRETQTIRRYDTAV